MMGFMLDSVNWSDAEAECAVCHKKMRFRPAFKVASSHGIKDNVIMCDNCLHVYQVDFGVAADGAGRKAVMTLKKDVTDKYPQITPKR